MEEGEPGEENEEPPKVGAFIPRLVKYHEVARNCVHSRMMNNSAALIGRGRRNKFTLLRANLASTLSIGRKHLICIRAHLTFIIRRSTSIHYYTVHV